MGIITVNKDLWENGCILEFHPFVEVLFFIFMICFPVIFIIFGISKQRERGIVHNDTHVSTRDLELHNPCDQHPVNISIDILFNAVLISYQEILFPVSESCIISIDSYIVLPIKTLTFNDYIVPLSDRKELIYYIDGSYSHRMQIGHSGFRASDGSSIVQCYSPQCPRRGSTESEVFAAYLAIKHATENHYTTLIIRTDNSKVEQLLCRPKDQDHCAYPDFCQILNQYRQENANNIIRVERVRGHTTRYEQSQCEIKREFAKIDRYVRKKNRQYIRRQQIEYEQHNVFDIYRCRVDQYSYYF